MRNSLKVLVFILLFVITCSCVSIKKHNDMKVRLLDNLASCEVKLFKANDTIENISRLRNACEERCKSYKDSLALCKNRESDIRKYMREVCFK